MCLMAKELKRAARLAANKKLAWPTRGKEKRGWNFTTPREMLHRIERSRAKRKLLQLVDEALVLIYDEVDVYVPLRAARVTKWGMAKDYEY